MPACYFPARGHRLFGVHHESRISVQRDCCVIMCYPAGQEYMRAHRSHLVLARQLAGHGFPVLRFEFRGCGNSSGDEFDWSLAGWRQDVSSAVSKGLDLSRATRACLMGMRLGASVALLAAQDLFELAGLVLWDPVCNGASHVAELRQLHREWLRGSFARHPSPTPHLEALGFSYPQGFVAELEALDLGGSVPAVGVPTLLLTGDRELVDAPFAQGMQVFHVDEDPVWLKREDDFNKGTVPVGALRAICDWMLATFPGEAASSPGKVPCADRRSESAGDVV